MVGMKLFAIAASIAAGVVAVSLAVFCADPLRAGDALGLWRAEGDY